MRIVKCLILLNFCRIKPKPIYSIIMKQIKYKKTNLSIFKKLISVGVFTFLFTSMQLSAQENHLFKIITDDPNYVSDKLVSLYLPTSFGKQSSMSVGIGADAIWNIQNKIEAQGSFEASLFSLAGGVTISSELGGAYSLFSKTKIKDAKVVISWSDSRGQTANYTYENKSVKWIDSKATYLTKTKLRGGLIMHKATYSNKVNAIEYNGPFSIYGVYGGFEISQQAALITEIDGKRGVTSGLTRYYADAFILPITRKDAASNGFGLGGRVGMWTIFNPNKGKRAKPQELRHYQAYQTMFFKIECGYRPIEKLYFSFGFGINFFKNR